jgi:peptidoglycan/LPS O-acetylase OafA/YrhL
MNENKLITELRGIAACMVMLFHFICVSNNFINNTIIFNIFQFGKYGVQLFFIISGFILTHSLLHSNFKYHNIPIFLLKRFIRIEPPYLISLFFLILFILFRSFIKDISINSQLSIDQVLLHIGYLIPFSKYEWLSIVYWTLAIEFQFYFFISFIFPLLLKFVWIRYFSILFLTIFTLSINPNHSIGLFHWLPLFLLGVQISFIKFLTYNNKNFDYLILLIINIVIFYKFSLTISIISLVVELLIIFTSEIKFKPFYFLGKISYSIYLIHTLVGFTLLNLLSHISDLIFVRFLFLLITIVVTILAAYFFNKYFEKPFQKLSTKIKYS